MKLLLINCNLLYLLCQPTQSCAKDSNIFYVYHKTTLKIFSKSYDVLLPHVFVNTFVDNIHKIYKKRYFDEQTRKIDEK